MEIEWDLYKITVRFAGELEASIEGRDRRNFESGDINSWLARLAGGGNLALPVSPKYVDIETVSSLPSTGSSGWMHVYTIGADIYTKESIVAMLSDRFAEENNGADLLAKMNAKQLAEAGLTYNPPDVSMDDAFGHGQGRGIFSFNGNREQFPPKGTQATNPADGKTYIFYRRPSAVGIKGFWMLPAIYEDWTRYE
jgi:hypothetical protein